MLTPQQVAHFDTFGFVLFRQAFSAEEMAAITSAAEESWQSSPQEIEAEERRNSFFLERNPQLAWLAPDERIYTAVTELLGPELLWVGSEGNVSSRNTVRWHPDRKYYLSGEEHWMDFVQIKIMIYLDDIDRDSGCLRVIPGSHKMPFHKSLANQELNPESQPFGVDGPDIPCVALTSQPGDVVLFNHTLWHGAFGGSARRRYIALKFAAWPTADYHIDSLRKYGTGVFEPHENFVNSDDVRIRDMVRIPEV